MINATVVGRVGRDSELRTTSIGPVLAFAVASDKKVKGEKTTTWVSCSVFGKRGESLAEYVTKGSLVACSGELSIRTSPSNGKAYLELRVDQLDLLGGGGTRSEQPKPPQAAGGKPWTDAEYTEPDDNLPF